MTKPSTCGSAKDTITMEDINKYKDKDNVIELIDGSAKIKSYEIGSSTVNGLIVETCSSGNRLDPIEGWFIVDKKEKVRRFEISKLIAEANGKRLIYKGFTVYVKNE